MKLIYVAGKMMADTAWEREQYIRHAEVAALNILKIGAAVHCPHAQCRFYDGEMPWGEWIKRDIEVLKRCDAIYMCSNWKSSTGATAEHDWALTHGMKICYALDEVEAYVKETDTSQDAAYSQPHEDPRRTAYVVELEKQVRSYNRALEKLERLGWTCSLEELPDKYEELQKKIKEAL